MCVVIAKPKGVQIRKKYLKNCYLSNPDGAGFMYVKEGKLVIDKGYFSFELFYQNYERAEATNTKSPFVIHFRIATSGGVDVDNCHPFEIDDHNAFAHNGIFYSLSFTQSKVSDTQMFNLSILKKLPPNWDQHHGIKLLIETYAKEASSKLVFLNDRKQIWICGEKDGEWFKGAWYSNAAYESVRSYGFSRGGYFNQYSEEETRYLGDNTAAYNSKTRCEECGTETPTDGLTYLTGFGHVCDDCWDEYTEALEAEI